MRIIKPSIEILTPIDREKILKTIELAGRTCYKSEDKITEDSASQFVKKVIRSGHLSVIEHYNITFKLICDRGCSHEVVRHRISSYSQESTRYANYSKDKFDNQITVIKPFFFENDSEKLSVWIKAMDYAEQAYMKLIKLGATPEQARSVLPNSLKTELVVTMNLRELRHFLKLRTSKASHPQIREIAIPLLEKLKEKLPEVFDDIELEK